MLKNLIYSFIATSLSVAYTACNVSAPLQKKGNRPLPESYNNSQDSTNTAEVNWKEFFTDPHLTVLIDSALKNNQELNITLQEIAISKNEIRARKGEYLPFVGLKGATGVEKTSRYTRLGALESNTKIEPGKENPDPLPDYFLATYGSWEVDIWRKLRYAKKAAVNRYLASVEGKNFMITNLVAEIANSYYELLGLDNELNIIRQNIDIQSNALEIVRLQKTAGRVTELAVRKFEAEVLKTKSLEYDIQQQIIQTENKINFLAGRYPQPISRSSEGLNNIIPKKINTGIPSQLLLNRPDIKRSEMDLAAAKLNVKVARAEFYPSVRITVSAGYQAFNTALLIKSPESILYSLASDLVAPLVNRNAIKSNYASANAKQVQAIYNYERTLLNAYVEVVNQLARINNLKTSYELKSKQVQALTQSIEISNALFKSARADYMEVLLTQRDALESKFELIETKKQQMIAMVNLYHSLGGGWR